MGDAPAQLLLIDDEASIREPLIDYLVGQGFAVDGASDAGTARAMMASKSYGLVICDIMMPGEDGLSLTRFIREGPGLPVILLTARAEETERIIGLEIGADDYVVKPFSPRELVARIRAVLRRAHGAVLPNEGDAESYR
ncbi:MAG: response regulator, partial [Sphingopyxis sp.]